MSAPGDLRPGGPPREVRSPGALHMRSEVNRWSPPVGVGVAVAVGLGAALCWSILRGILELSVGLLVVSALGGWGIGAALRRGLPSRALALLLGAGAWVVSLASTWVVTRVTLPSDRDIWGRLEQTSFVDFTAQQFGLLEVLSLLLFAGVAALVVDRRPASG